MNAVTTQPVKLGGGADARAPHRAYLRHMLTKQVPEDSPPVSPLHPDIVAVSAVAALDSARAPGGDALVGELNGEIVAVITMRDGHVVANPFRATAAVVDLLRNRRAALLAGAW